MRQPPERPTRAALAAVDGAQLGEPTVRVAGDGLGGREQSLVRPLARALAGFNLTDLFLLARAA